jgi:K+-sensing histidine kinase KdpD
VATELARESGKRLHIVHVVPPVTDPGDSPNQLKRLAAEAGDGVRVETAFLSGRVAQQIIRYAQDKRIGLIVLGTHGRTGVSRAVLGSVAEGVVRLASCPVLTIPAAVDEAGLPVASDEWPDSRGCIVCGGNTDDLICEACRTRIRGEALERKAEVERAGRRGSPL